MNPALGLKFFVISGAVLVITGVLQALVRPRKAHERGLMRIINRGTLWAGVCVAVGLLGIMIGVGAVPLHGLR